MMPLYQIPLANNQLPQKTKASDSNNKLTSSDANNYRFGSRSKKEFTNII